MSKIFLASAVLVALGTVSLAEESPKYYVQTIKIDEFLTLPFDLQIIYVAGITDGFTYVMRNYDVPNYDEYSSCIRRISLKVATEEMLEQIKQRKEEEPLMTYFAKSLGTRCRHK